MGGYPPGAENDPRAPYNQEPYPDHRHEFQPTADTPRVESGKLIFVEECRWAPVISSVTDSARDEIYEEHGEPCGETREYRFQETKLTGALGTTWDLTEDVPERISLKLEEIEHDLSVGHLGHSVDEVSIVDIDPDPDCGVAIINHGLWTIRYEP